MNYLPPPLYEDIKPNYEDDTNCNIKSIKEDIKGIKDIISSLDIFNIKKLVDERVQILAQQEFDKEKLVEEKYNDIPYGIPYEINSNTIKKWLFICYI